MSAGLVTRMSSNFGHHFNGSLESFLIKIVSALNSKRTSNDAEPEIGNIMKLDHFLSHLLSFSALQKISDRDRRSLFSDLSHLSSEATRKRSKPHSAPTALDKLPARKKSH